MLYANLKIKTNNGSNILKVLDIKHQVIRNINNNIIQPSKTISELFNRLDMIPNNKNIDITKLENLVVLDKNYLAERIVNELNGLNIKDDDSLLPLLQASKIKTLPTTIEGLFEQFDNITDNEIKSVLIDIITDTFDGDNNGKYLLQYLAYCVQSNIGAEVVIPLIKMITTNIFGIDNSNIINRFTNILISILSETILKQETYDEFSKFVNNNIPMVNTDLRKIFNRPQTDENSNIFESVNLDKVDLDSFKGNEILLNKLNDPIVATAINANNSSNKFKLEKVLNKNFTISNGEKELQVSM